MWFHDDDIGYEWNRKCSFLMTKQNLLSVNMKCMKQTAFEDQFFDTFIRLETPLRPTSNDSPYFLSNLLLIHTNTTQNTKNLNTNTNKFLNTFIRTLQPFDQRIYILYINLHSSSQTYIEIIMRNANHFQN